MRTTFGLILLVHAGLHILAFLSAWGLERPLLPTALRRTRSPLSGDSSTRLVRGVCWFLVGGAIAVAGSTAFLATAWWAAYTVAALSCSLVLAIFEWDAVPAAALGAMLDVTLIALLWTSHLLDVLL